MKVGRRASAALLLLGAACRRPLPLPEPPPEPVAPPAAIPAGRLQDHTFVDGRWPLAVTVPDAWTARIGDESAPERLRLTDPEGDVEVTVAVTHGEALAPRPREDCSWDFTDSARYRAVKVPGSVLAATCTSADPDTPRVLAYVVARDGVLYHVEGRVPQGHLRPGKADLDAIAGGVRFR